MTMICYDYKKRISNYFLENNFKGGYYYKYLKYKKNI